ncbi:MAG: response regulator transcription factor [Candidatus Sericytochromatia bacterium]
MSRRAERPQPEREHVLLWTREPLQGDYLSTLYQEAGFAVQQVSAYQVLRDLLRSYRHVPVLIVIGHFDRLQQLTSLQKLVPLASLLVLTSQQQLQTGLKLLEAGADAYLMQPVQPEELIAESQALLRHARRIMRHFGQIQPAAPLCYGPLQLQPETRQVEIQQQRITLTARQFKCLHYLCLHANTVVTRAQLSGVLQAAPHQTSPRQLDQLVLALRRRLPAGDDWGLETRYGEGYLLRLYTVT